MHVIHNGSSFLNIIGNRYIQLTNIYYQIGTGLIRSSAKTSVWSSYILGKVLKSGLIEAKWNKRDWCL